MKQHPILSELKVNEDGTNIVWKGQSLDVKNYKIDRNNYPQKFVNFNGQTHTILKLICEAWNGERPEIGMIVKRRDFNPDNYHYTNLYWAHRGGMRTKLTKRIKNSKISENDIEVIIERINAGESLRAIAKTYNTSDMSIYRIKRRYITDKKMILKDAIMRARDGYYKRLAYARYFGFKTIDDAVGTLGQYQFIIQSKNLAL